MMIAALLVLAALLGGTTSAAHDFSALLEAEQGARASRPSPAVFEQVVSRETSGTRSVVVTIDRGSVEERRFGAFVILNQQILTLVRVTLDARAPDDLGDSISPLAILVAGLHHAVAAVAPDAQSAVPITLQAAETRGPTITEMHAAPFRAHVEVGERTVEVRAAHVRASASMDGLALDTFEIESSGQRLAGQTATLMRNGDILVGGSYRLSSRGRTRHGTGQGFRLEPGSGRFIRKQSAASLPPREDIAQEMQGTVTQLLFKRLLPGATVSPGAR